MSFMPKPHEIYKHFKGNLYQIVAIAQHSETDELLVVYQALYGDFRTYARPLDMFTDRVDKVKYPEAEQEFRFELQGAGSLASCGDGGSSEKENQGFGKRESVSESREPASGSREPVSESRESVFGSREPVSESRKPVSGSRESVSESGQRDAEAGRQVSEAQTESGNRGTAAATETVTATQTVTATGTDTAVGTAAAPEGQASEAGELNLDPLVLEFLDADSYGQRLNILAGLHHRITDEMITVMALSCDIEVEEGDTEVRYSSLRNCLLTLEKYECDRPRRLEQ